MIRRAVYAGTFDPITTGHLDIIKRAAGLFDELIIAVAKSERKTPRYDLSQRLQLVHAAVADLKSVSVKEFSDLTIAFAAKHEAHYLVRGLRTAKDFDYESEIAAMNRQMAEGVLETVFLPAKPQYAYISSSIVRELLLLKAYDQLQEFVPDQVLALIQGFSEDI